MVTYAAQHNGGRVQLGLADFFVGGDFPFINCIKGSDGWGQAGGTVPDPNNLDSDGYPTAIVGGGVSLVFFIAPQTVLPGDYILDWQGNGTLTMGAQDAGSTAFVSGSLTSSGGSGSYRFTPINGCQELRLGITAVGTPRITNIRCYHVSEVSRLAAGEQFGAKFLDRLMNEMKPGVLRDHGWTEGNVNCLTKASDLKPVSYVFYKGDEYRATWWAGDTSLSGLVYSVSAPPSFSGLTNKNIVQYVVQQPSPRASFGPVTFTNGSANIGIPAHGMSIDERFFVKSDGGAPPANFTDRVAYFVKSVPDANTITASLTQGGATIIAGALGNPTYVMPVVYLKVGTSAAKILLSNGNPMISGDNSYPLSGQVATAIYDSTIDMWLQFGGTGGYGFRGMMNGTPIQPFIQLCAQVGAHPHLIKEHMSCFPEADVSTFKATYIRDNFNGDNAKPCPWMQTLFEGPNELWNSASDFFPTHYANQLAKALGTGWDFHEVYGMFLSTLGQAVDAVYSGDTSKYLVGCGVQTASLSGGGSGNDPRVTAAKWVAAGAPTQPGYTISAATKCKVLLPSTYWGSIYLSGFDGTGTEADMITRWAAATDQNVKDAIIDQYIQEAQIFHSGWPFDVPGLYTYLWSGAKTMAIRLGLTRVRGYEGGASFDYSGGSDTRLFRNAAKSGKMAAATEIQAMNSFVSLTGSGVTFEYPSLFLLSDAPFGATPNGNGWALFNNGATIYGPVSPRYTAVCNWSAGKRSRLGFRV